MTGFAVRTLLAYPPKTPLFCTPGGVEVAHGMLSNLVAGKWGAKLPRKSTNRFEERICGYVTPPVTGQYTFWISSSERAECWLSTNDHAGGIARIIKITTALERAGKMGPRPGGYSWNLMETNGLTVMYPGLTLSNAPSGLPEGLTTRASAPQKLLGGKRYYFEIRNEVKPNNFVLLGWRKPGQPATGYHEVPNREVLAPYCEARK